MISALRFLAAALFVAVLALKLMKVQPAEPDRRETVFCMKDRLDKWTCAPIRSTSLKIEA